MWNYWTVVAWTLSNLTALSEEKILIDNPPQVATVQSSRGEVSLIYACHLTYSAMDYPEVRGNNTQLFETVKSNLSRAIETGAVERCLRWDGQREGFASSDSVKTGNYSFSYLVLDQGSSPSSSSSSSSLSRGAIAGIVIGGVIVGCILFYCVYLLVVAKRALKEFPAYPTMDMAGSGAGGDVVKTAEVEVIL